MRNRLLEIRSYDSCVLTDQSTLICIKHNGDEEPEDRTTQLTTLVWRLSGIRTKNGQTNWEECGSCPVFAIYTLAFALQLRKKHGKPSVRVAEECQLARWKQNIQNRAYITIRIHKHNVFGILAEIWTWASRNVSQAVLSVRLWLSARGNWKSHRRSPVLTAERSDERTECCRISWPSGFCPGTF
jgi:hypothetical protein